MTPEEYYKLIRKQYEKLLAHQYDEDLITDRIVKDTFINQHLVVNDIPIGREIKRIYWLYITGKMPRNIYEIHIHAFVSLYQETYN